MGQGFKFGSKMRFMSLVSSKLRGVYAVGDGVNSVKSPKAVVQSGLNIDAALDGHTRFYPSNASLSYSWSFGSLAMLCLAIQILTGLFLAMHYVSSTELAFASVEHIMRNVNYGWLIRYMHSNGASFFFITVYLHLARGLFHRSFSVNGGAWLSGVVMFLLLIIIAFLGYVLPWGQMSFWGATVITNLCSAIPFIGDSIVYWLWGGYSVGGPTLQRFASLHYALPFALLGLMIAHILLLHTDGSGNPLGAWTSGIRSVRLLPELALKDVVGVHVFLAAYVTIVCFYPNLLGHPDNYIEADPYNTPTHIVPEWYFLPFYAILRAIPNKPLGVLGMLAAILILAALPFAENKGEVQSSQFHVYYKALFFTFVIAFMFLGWLGAQPAEEPYTTASRLSTLWYFIYFILVLNHSRLVSFLRANAPRHLSRS